MAELGKPGTDAVTFTCSGTILRFSPSCSRFHLLSEELDNIQCRDIANIIMVGLHGFEPRTKGL
jgi:hypothetical protein